VLPKGELTAAALVTSASTYLGWNILYEAQPAAPTGAASRHSTRLQAQIVTDREGCEELLHSLLLRWQLVVTPVAGKRDTYEVIDLAGPRARDVAAAAAFKTPEQILARPGLETPVITSVELHHTDARLAHNALRPFLASVGSGVGTVQIGHVGEAKGLIVQGMQSHVARTIHLLREADVEAGLPDRIERLTKRLRELEQRIEALQERTRK
jgi:hypothetical protein